MIDSDQEHDENVPPTATSDVSPEVEPSEQAEQPQITLDRYLSRRRPSPRMGWAQIVSMVVMLVALLMIVFYKDRCGGMVGNLMNQFGPADKPGSTVSPPVHYRFKQ